MNTFEQEKQELLEQLARIAKMEELAEIMKKNLANYSLSAKFIELFGFEVKPEQINFGSITLKSGNFIEILGFMKTGKSELNKVIDPGLTFTLCFHLGVNGYKIAKALPATCEVNDCGECDSVLSGTWSISSMGIKTTGSKGATKLVVGNCYFNVYTENWELKLYDK